MRCDAMGYRPFGVTDLQVSEPYLGATVVGGWGNADDGCLRIVPRRARRLVATSLLIGRP